MKSQGQQAPAPKSAATQTAAQTTPLAVGSEAINPVGIAAGPDMGGASGLNPLSSMMPAGNLPSPGSGSGSSANPQVVQDQNPMLAAYTQSGGGYNPTAATQAGAVAANPAAIAPGAAMGNPTAAGGAGGALSNEWGSVTGSVAPYGQIQNGVNTSGVPALASGDALGAQMTQAQNAAYQNATGYLDPQWQNQQTQLQNQLANQGVMQNSDAWNKAMDDFARQKQFAYQQAQSNAYSQGLAAQNQLFGQGLQANQNSYSQALNSGQFANSAQQQGYNQNLSNATFANSAQNQIATQGLQNRGIQEQLQAAQAQAGATQAAAAASANASMANMQAQLQAQMQQNQFNNSLAARNQQINELQLQQQNPLQVLAALNGGQGVTQPNFTNTPGTNVGSTDIMQAIQNAYQGQLTGYNAQTGAANSNNAAMASIIAAMICDRRLKKNIRFLGYLPSGCALYEFEYLWGEKAVGPMADEVERVKPEAIFTIGQYKAVNLARL